MHRATPPPPPAAARPSRARAAAPLFQFLALGALGALGACSAIEDLFESDSGGGVPRWRTQDTRQGVAVDEQPVVSGFLLAYRASEATTGSTGTDFNGDGDFSDRVVVVVDMRNGKERVLGATAQSIAIRGEDVYLETDEDADGMDWNGDGDRLDSVLLHWSRSTGPVGYVAELDPAGPAPMLAAGDLLYFVERPSVPLLPGETALHFLTEDAPRTPVRVFNADSANALRPRISAYDEGLLVLYQSELLEGRDLNTDGDQQDDAVLALLDTTDPSALLRSVDLPLPNGFSPVRALAADPGDWLVAFLVSEAKQGVSNLNDPALFPPGWQPPQCLTLDDTDADDDVLHYLWFADWVADPVANPPVNTGLVGDVRVLAARGSGGARGWVATVSAEADEGDCSLNFDAMAGNDSDQSDRVLRWVEADGVPGGALPFTHASELVALFEPAGGTGGVVELDERFVAIVDEEADSRNHDNFFGLSSKLLATLDPNEGPAAAWTYDHLSGGGVLYIGALWMRASQDGAAVLVAVQEELVGEPLNSGDSDTVDDVPAYATFDMGDLDFPGPPVALDPANAGLAVGNGVMIYRADEAADGRDWNDDGDLADQVLLLTPLDELDRVVYIGQPSLDTPSATVTVGGDWGAAYVAKEATEGEDLNGDGDLADFVVRWLRL